VISELEVLQQLQANPELLQAIRDAAGSELSTQRKLRSLYDAQLVRAALSLNEVRKRARGVLDDADDLWLTATGLEQATHPIVAAHKAARFPKDVRVLDLCSGIGCDAAALSGRGPVTVVDTDEAMLRRCEWNLSKWGSDVPQLRGDDALQVDLTGQIIHLDPDRRSGRSRPAKRLELYSPDLAWMQEATRSAAGGAIKIGPASNFIQKFSGCEIELISLRGECREATVWFGELAECEQFRATVLPSGETICGDPLDAWANVADEPAQYLFDPDPAVVRSGLIDGVCERLALERLDPEEEYLTSDCLPESSFVTAFEVEAVLPNNQKQLRQYLRQSPGKYYEVKCRRIPMDAAAVARKLPTGDGPVKVVFFLRVQGKTRVVIAKRLPTT
jgi:hypothetical protein